MEAIKLLQGVKQLAAHYGKPQLSHIEVAELAVLKQLAAINKVDMPMILDEEKREKFMDKIELLEGFLESQRGMAAIEFLVNAWDAHCYDIDHEAAPVAEDAEEEED